MVSLKRPSTLLFIAFLVILANPALNDLLTNLFGRDGIVINIIQALPGGGFATSVVHALRGDRMHALQAAIAGFGTLSAVVLSGPVGGAVVAITVATVSTLIQQNEGIFKERSGSRFKREVHGMEKTPAALAGVALAPILPDEVFRLFKESHLNLDKAHAARHAMWSRNSERAGQLFLEALNEKIIQNANEISVAEGGRRGRIKRNARELSAESGGTKKLKSVEHGTYLHAHNSTVRMVHGSAGGNEQWYIEDWHGKVVFKARGASHKAGQFLSANLDGSVDMVEHHPHNARTVFWKPLKNKNGSWSFLSIHGSFLSAREDRTVTTVVRCLEWEEFELDWWHH
ncbi:hypothetical protein PMAYCL1PPCAC_26087 [Pristionchus mayeri]|uniref:Ricin B lectin domain-containing protein n=1 Tax=Pristionchus mayeri TaxID=1317129 RepID=A0AAN5D4F0_9BILA|nr:hypothetical protein PMAYCL1PPCAC_26087 [Pristionchus mayeri]